MAKKLVEVDVLGSLVLKWRSWVENLHSTCILVPRHSAVQVKFHSTAQRHSPELRCVANVWDARYLADSFEKALMCFSVNLSLSFSTFLSLPGLSLSFSLSLSLSLSFLIVLSTQVLLMCGTLAIWRTLC